MAECIDLVNSRGEITTTGLVRSEYERQRGDYPDEYMQIIIVLGVNALGEVLVHQRAERKKVDKNKIDKVCETVIAGESTIDAAIRGVDEEAGLHITADQLVLARASVNEYGRYRTLYAAVLDDGKEPKANDPHEVAWTKFIAVEELIEGVQTGEMEFVDGFFTDAAIAISALRAHPAIPEVIRSSLDKTAEKLTEYNRLHE